MAVRPFFKKLCKSALAFFGMLFVLYVLLEATFFYYFSWIFPVAAIEMGNIGIGAALLGQYTKSGVYPRNYIGITGDSYAFGQGDWLLEGEHKIRPPYGAAHILHDQLKRDVLTFGFPASDSIRANNVLPKAMLDATRFARFFEIEPPESLIVYFYEGNDLNDNVEVADRLIYPMLGSQKDIYNVEKFQKDVMPALVEANPITVMSKNISPMDRLFFFNFAKSLLIQAYTDYRSGQTRPPWKPPRKGKTTRVNVGGKVDYLQNHIQSPALSLDAEEIHLGVYIFEQSLIALQHEFPDAHIGIAYIPAVITAYDVVSPNIDDYYEDSESGHNRIRPSSAIRKNSDAICEQIRGVALRRHVGFVDPRRHLRSVAKDHYIHGPIDWNHFNRLGYETLSKDLILLLEQIEKPVGDDLPGCQWE